MITLAFEASAKSASVALSRDGKIISSFFHMSGLTHSKTLLPMAEQLLCDCEMTMDDVDVFAVSQGPGSFTGIRIGVSTVKGLSWGAQKPAVGVSTLEAMAYNGQCTPEGTVICCAMDARRNQVYNALFRFEGGKLIRLCPDRAIGLDELCAELKDCSSPIFVVGDGGELCYNHLSKELENITLAPENIRYQTAVGVCLAARDKEPHSAGELLPVYLRLSQAERERLAKLNEK